MHLIEATYYVLSLLSQGFEAAEGRKPVAEPEFRPFNLSVLRRPGVRVERTTTRSVGIECCGARQRPLHA
jgi:hypothetical protein